MPVAVNMAKSTWHYSSGIYDACKGRKTWNIDRNFVCRCLLCTFCDSLLLKLLLFVYQAYSSVVENISSISLDFLLRSCSANLLGKFCDVVRQTIHKMLFGYHKLTTNEQFWRVYSGTFERWGLTDGFFIKR